MDNSTLLVQLRDKLNQHYSPLTNEEARELKQHQKTYLRQDSLFALGTTLSSLKQYGLLSIPFMLYYVFVEPLSNEEKLLWLAGSLLANIAFFIIGPYLERYYINGSIAFQNSVDEVGDPTN